MVLRWAKSIPLSHDDYHHKGPSWICDVCGKTFRDKSDLKKHEVVHTGEKIQVSPLPSQYTANRALKAFSANSREGKRTRENAWEGFSKKYPSCSASFLSESELRSHIDQIHSKNEEGNVWLCKLCGKVFANQQRLTRHDLVHNKVKKHTCTVCNRDFTFLHNLKKHLKAVHLKEQFTCPQPGCDKKYGHSSNFSEHLRKKHGIYSAKYRAKQAEKLESREAEDKMILRYLHMAIVGLKMFFLYQQQQLRSQPVVIIPFLAHCLNLPQN
ncbi:putative zinc finger protein [Orchesella cincta]|uniref:Putative zinc finger protein n=1 Tax=Orchesella cincta TaxID=48709 RepID=A0A1D2M5I7_ORCCI|nr:putative zinc finger protein [Orchesella cincta]